MKFYVSALVDVMIKVIIVIVIIIIEKKKW